MSASCLRVSFAFGYTVNSRLVTRIPPPLQAAEDEGGGNGDRDNTADLQVNRA